MSVEYKDYYKILGVGKSATQDEISKAFDRESVAALYKTAVDSTGKPLASRDALSAKMQSDVLSSLNQSTVLRHRTRLQCVAAAVGRAEAHAQYSLEAKFLRPIATMEAAS